MSKVADDRQGHKKQQKGTNSDCRSPPTSSEPQRTAAGPSPRSMDGRARLGRARTLGNLLLPNAPHVECGVADPHLAAEAFSEERHRFNSHQGGACRIAPVQLSALSSRGAALAHLSRHSCKSEIRRAAPARSSRVATNTCCIIPCERGGRLRDLRTTSSALVI